MFFPPFLLWAQGPGVHATHAYDSMNQLASRTDPVGATESFEYDRLGNLVRHTDRKGQVSTFTYERSWPRGAGSGGRCDPLHLR